MKSKVIRVNEADLNRMYRLFPRIRGESLSSYFRRYAEELKNWERQETFCN